MAPIHQAGYLAPQALLLLNVINGISKNQAFIANLKEAIKIEIFVNINDFTCLWHSSPAGVCSSILPGKRIYFLDLILIEVRGELFEGVACNRQNMPILKSVPI